ncbi:MAG: ABC transporter ATP-binding protein [Phycisphaerae bacterium]
MIRVTNLTKRYGALAAVDDISFHVERGTVVGFLGPNGAGKTTTIRILACYQSATSGSATVGGDDVFTNSMAVRRRIGYLPESAPLYPEMRVREYLHFRGKLRGMTRPERIEATRRVAERCWLGEFIDRPIGQLSKGMRQRVGLGDAIMHDPDVLILDEPTVGLDPTQIRETRNLIRELGRRHTILLSSHILHDVEQICSDAMIIASGRIVAAGSLDALRGRFRTGSRIVAEIRGPERELEDKVRALAGVSRVELAANDGWTRLAVDAAPDRDVREDLFKLTTAQGWSLREIRREGGSLEDFFVQVTAEQHQRQATALA